VLARADAVLRAAPPHARHDRARTVARLHDALAGSVDARTVRALAFAAHLPDDAWLAAVEAMVGDPAARDLAARDPAARDTAVHDAAVHAVAAGSSRAPSHRGDRVAALVLLLP
jgi:hypothetical protein